MTPRKVQDSPEPEFVMNIYKGITYSKVFQYTQANGSGINMSGIVLRITFRGVRSTDLVLTTDDALNANGSRFYYTDQTSGEFRLQLGEVETGTFTCGPGTWWIERIDGTDIDLMAIDQLNVIEVD